MQRWFVLVFFFFNWELGDNPRFFLPKVETKLIERWPGTVQKKNDGKKHTANSLISSLLKGPNCRQSNQPHRCDGRCCQGCGCSSRNLFFVPSIEGLYTCWWNIHVDSWWNKSCTDMDEYSIPWIFHEWDSFLSFMHLRVCAGWITVASNCILIWCFKPRKIHCWSGKSLKRDSFMFSARRFEIPPFLGLLIMFAWDLSPISTIVK